MKPSFPPVQRVPQAGLLALALLAGCAGHSEPPRDTQQQAQIQNFVGKGYLSEEQYSLRTTPQAWTVAGRDLDLILSVPARAGQYPLIVYLPGIGEPRTAGEAWRKTWAQAGYAVLSLQLLAADGQAWQSRSARNGDFQSVVRERFGAAAMAERQAALADLLAELHRRHDDPLLQNVDLNRVVLAGYDLGAYTALVAAGEKTKAAAGSRRAPLPLAAVVLLSPYADFSGPGFETRYQDVAVPVLSVTGDGDEDSYGLVNSASVRRAPFQYMPAGGKYLLSFNDATHDLLSGNAPRERNRDEDGNQGSQNGEDRNGGNGGGRHGGRSGGPGGMGGGQGGPGGGMDGGFGNRGGQQGGRGGDGPGGSGNPYLQPAIQAVTTAFLDSVVKQDDIAQEWLRKDARRWLRDEATLTAK